LLLLPSTARASVAQKAAGQGVYPFE